MNLTNKGNFIINDELEFSPKLNGLHIGFESLASDNSGRTLDGVMRIYWIFNRIRKVEIEMPPMTAYQVSLLLSRVQGQSYNLKYWDPLENRTKTIYVYTSNSSADCYSGYIKNGLYEGVKFNAIELAGEYDETNTKPVSLAFNSNSLLITEYNDRASFSRSGDNLKVKGIDANKYDIEGDLLTYEE